MNSDLLRLGWCMVRIALFMAFTVAVVLIVTVAMRSVADAEEIGQQNYSQHL